jgi:hypothetical protein
LTEDLFRSDLQQPKQYRPSESMEDNTAPGIVPDLLRDDAGSRCGSEPQQVVGLTAVAREPSRQRRQVHQ